MQHLGKLAFFERAAWLTSKELCMNVVEYYNCSLTTTELMTSYSGDTGKHFSADMKLPYPGCSMLLRINMSRITPQQVLHFILLYSDHSVCSLCSCSLNTLQNGVGVWNTFLQPCCIETHISTFPIFKLCICQISQTWTLGGLLERWPAVSTCEQFYSRYSSQKAWKNVSYHQKCLKQHIIQTSVEENKKENAF